MNGASTSTGTVGGSWVTQDRLLQLLTASPQHATMAAGRLVDMAKDFSATSSSTSSTTNSTPQIDLLWRIAGFLFRKRWETRVTAALALENVASVMDPAELAQCLFGISSSSTSTRDTGSSSRSTSGNDQDNATPVVAESITSTLPVNVGLLRFASLDMTRVLADGEPLVASTGEEYELGRARECLSREELERQKVEIVKRLGLLEVPDDAKTRRALARLKDGGEDQLEGCYGIGDEDLLSREEGKEIDEDSSRMIVLQHRRKRNVREIVSGGGDGKAASLGGSIRKIPTTEEATNATLPGDIHHHHQQQQQQSLPWLAEHLSVRLFDALWETRHGAVLGLTALFKAWRRRGKGSQQQQQQQQEEEEEEERGNVSLPLTAMNRWLEEWGEDVACRCLCLLALDRFGDYSLGTTVAPIREVTGQLLGLVLLVGKGQGKNGEDNMEEHHAGHFEAVLEHVKTLIGPLQQTSSSVMTWEVRHGGFVGLKYLVALPSRQVLFRTLVLLQWATEGLNDSVEDVREAAATAGLSLLQALKGQNRQRGATAEVTAADLERVLWPVFQALMQEGGREEEDDTSMTTIDSPSQVRTRAEKEEGVSPKVDSPFSHPCNAVACAPYLATFFRLANQALQLLEPYLPGNDITHCFGKMDEESSNIDSSRSRDSNRNSNSSRHSSGSSISRSRYSHLALGHPGPPSKIKRQSLPIPRSPFPFTPAHVISHLFLVGTRTSEPSIRAPALELLASVVEYWGGVRIRCENAKKYGWRRNLITFEASKRLNQVTLPAMAWKVLAALADGLKREKNEKNEEGPSSLMTSLINVWKAMVAALSPLVITTMVGPITNAYLYGDLEYDIFPLTSLREDCAAIQRVVPALVVMVKQKVIGEDIKSVEREAVIEGMALEALRRRDGSSEKAAFLLGQLFGEGCGEFGRGKREEHEKKVKMALWEVLVEESRVYYPAKYKGAVGQPAMWQMRRLMLATAVALVQGAVDVLEGGVLAVEKPGLLVRALMESVKEEADKERRALAAKWLMCLGVSPFEHKQECLEKEKKGETAFEKAMRNLCVLACHKGENLEYPFGRVGAREALKQFAVRISDTRCGEIMHRFWHSLYMSLAHRSRGVSGGLYDTDSEEEEEKEEDLWSNEKESWRNSFSFTVEDAIRLVMIMTPVVQKDLLSRFARYVPSLLQRACMDEDRDHANTKLVNLLAARAARNIFKQLPPDDLPHLARQMAQMLHYYLRKRRTQREENRRVRAAFCVLEVAKGLREMPHGSEHVKKVLPFLLPVALMTVADDNEEVRLYGAEGFRLLVEIAPLLKAGEWAVGEIQEQQQRQQQQQRVKAAIDVEQDSEKRKKAKRVMRKERANASFVACQNTLLHLLLGNKARAHIIEGPAQALPAAAIAASAGPTRIDRRILTLPDSLSSCFRGGLVLRPYQWEGVMWLTLLRRAGLHGALCDDMGLGKTLQALVAIAVARCEEDAEESEEEGGENSASSSSSHLPSLVLCPASLAGHWDYESRRFFSAETIQTVLYAVGLSPKDKASLIAGLGKRHLVVASYDMLRRDLARSGGGGGGGGGRGLLTGQAWKYVIFDEVHVLRSGQATVLGRAVKALRAQHRLALTGTPLQNQVHDLWGVFDVLTPGLLGTKVMFETEYGRPIGKATLKNASADATAEALGKLERLHAHLLPFLLRREKGKVLKDLPPKTITDLACDLVPLQIEMYEGHCHTEQAQSVLEGLNLMLRNGGGEKEEAGMAAGREVKQQLGGQALRLLHYLRLLCVHPALVLQAGSAAREQLIEEVECSGKMVALQNLLFACGVVKDFQEGEIEEGDGDEGGEDEEEDMEEEKEDVDRGHKRDENKMVEEEDTVVTFSLPSPPASGPQPPTADAAPNSTSADINDDLHRCLIFAQHRVTLDAIEKSILRRAQWNPAYAEQENDPTSITSNSGSSGSNGKSRVPATIAPGTRYLRLDGSVPSGQREELVQRFNRDRSIPIMLLTTRVGSLGLNLTGADIVIFMEHDWNPAVDLQAMDRSHRIGQGRPVNVYRLVTKGTVEEQVMALQRRKRGLADAVVTERNAASFEDRGGMSSVLDFVAASVGMGGGGVRGGFDGDVTIGFGTGDASDAPSLSSATGVGILSEEAWGEEQYSTFAVERFLAEIVRDG
ncbi:hypothetical protein VYU27_001613 [Nannochloropsis oceanica]